MSSRRRDHVGGIVLALALMAVVSVTVGGCGAASPADTGRPSPAPTPTTVVGPSGTTAILRIGVTGGTFDPQSAYLIDAIAQHSSGRLRVEHADEWDITGTDPEAEQKILKAVAAGDIDLGLVGVRSLSSLGVTDFEALIAPMLIDSYQLERSVLDSDVPNAMLPALGPLGVSGLGVIGGGLRFPSGVEAPFLGPDTYAGKTFHVFDSVIGMASITALGATATNAVPDARDVGLADGTIDGMEATLSFAAGKPALLRHATINVPLWPAIGILVASPARIAALDSQQVGSLTAAVADTETHALDVLIGDQESVRSICDQGGHAYLASAADLGAIGDALRPVYERLIADPKTAAYVARISALKRPDQVQALRVPDGCGGPSTGSDTRLPDGAYRTTQLGVDDLVAVLKARGIAQTVVDAVKGSDMAAQTYTITYKFTAGTFVQFEESNGHEEVGSSGTFRLLDDAHLEFNESCCGATRFQFTFDGDVLRLRVDSPDEDVQRFCTESPMDCIGFLRVVEAGAFIRQD